jgi:two-component system, cell cycle response regulator
MRVLTVDDSRAIRIMVRKLCAELGCEVVEAENGEQALALLVQERFDLVVLDVTMPLLDGPGALARLRERGDLTPVVMLTSERMQSTVEQVGRLGVSGYVKKPFTREELREAVARVVGAPEGTPVAAA